MEEFDNKSLEQENNFIYTPFLEKIIIKHHNYSYLDILTFVIHYKQ
jgi:hypothetical protein